MIQSILNTKLQLFLKRITIVNLKRKRMSVKKVYKSKPNNKGRAGNLYEILKSNRP